MEKTINQDRCGANWLSAKIQIQSEYGANVTGEWLEDAVRFDAAILGAAPDVMAIVDQLFPELLDAIAKDPDSKIKNTKTVGSKSRIKYTCKTVLFNLYVAYLMNAPVRYSRRKESYAADKRYGRIFFKHARLTATIAAFEALGLIHQKAGIFDRKKSFGRQSRIWASQKLASLFSEATQGLPQQLYQEEPVERVVLRNSNKKPVGYTDTNETNSIRENLNKYNDFISQQEVTVASDGNREISLYNLSNKMYLSLLKGKATLVKLDILNNHEYYDKVNNNIHIVDSDIVDNDSSNILYNYNNIYYNTSMTGSLLSKLSDSTIKCCVNKSQLDDWLTRRASPLVPVNNKNSDNIFLKSDKFLIGRKEQSINFVTANNLYALSKVIRNKLLVNNDGPGAIKEKVSLKNLDINQLAFVINSKKLYRVFNNKSFELGGRFYGALYQTMPKEFRKDIFIDGEPTVELDYAAHHIRIPYHQEGIDYREDPYLALTDDPEERSIFKKLLLIALNAETEKKAVRGFRDACISAAKKMNIALTNKNICGLLERVRATHNQIAGYINSGAGCRLQNLDSQITEAILMRMTDMAIPCLPVHDSYIVPRQHEDRLRDVMVGEYKAVLGFEPVIK